MKPIAFTPLSPTRQQTALEQTLARLAQRVASAEISVAERAALRRMSASRAPPMAFFKLAYGGFPEDWEQRPVEWMTLTAGMALMCPDPHRSDRPAGRMLAETGFSESRLERLLAAKGDVLSELVWRAAYHLAARGVSVDWTDFARLLLAQDNDERKAAGWLIAREFFRPSGERHKK